ncbi:MAG: Brp/Blh family beta-carotene 15,15'-dioxygenase [bacterium]|nr:Brp/Blh family beta-carotene 15,15'-dioxygenase [bacterium]
MINVDQRTLREWHKKAVLPFLSGCAFVGLFWNPDVSIQVVIMLIGIATIGLGHGAMDHRVGEILMRPRFGRNWAVIFTLAYLALVAMGFGGWIIAPAPALILFLAYSALHFGSDRFQANSTVHAASRGAIPLLLPVAFHPEEVSNLFSMITSTDLRVEQYVLPVGLLAALAVFLTVISAVRRREFIQGTETLLLVALNITNPPLVAFTLYFVFLHSIGHIIELAGWLEPKSVLKGFRRIVRESLPLTALLVLASALVISLARVVELKPAIIQTVFIGLSCLTVPHMVVTHAGEKWFSRQEFGLS